MCRQIDEVRLSGPGAKPVAVYTFDCDPAALSVDGYRPATARSMLSFDEEDDEIEDGLHFDHPDILRMHNVDTKFMDIFRFGFKARIVSLVSLSIAFRYLERERLSFVIVCTTRVEEP